MVDFMLNYDGLFEELKMLLSCMLFVLLNGVLGIVVGFVIEILLYNLCEVVVVVVVLICNLKFMYVELMSLIFGLDFFGGG